MTGTLKRLAMARMRYDRAVQRYAECEEIATSIGALRYDRDRVQGGAHLGGIESQAIRLVECGDRRDEAEKAYWRAWAEVAVQKDRLTDREWEVLCGYYRDGRTVNQVADALRISQRQCLDEINAVDVKIK